MPPSDIPRSNHNYYKNKGLIHFQNISNNEFVKYI